ncbi:VIR protein [Plasmodium vivax]|uniref:VIR protein n=1 Tax=Plasmodium vivax TaxID=5855 RepID=A0A1G4H8F6_PLAVI|nr:VIR protein [Plasmodium vivax]
MEDPTVQQYKIPANIIYEKFNTNMNLDLSGKCASLKSNHPEHYNSYFICNYLVTNLSELCDKTKTETLEPKKCTYLHYWINSKIINLDNLNDDKYSKIVEDILSLWDKMISNEPNNPCECKYISDNKNHVINTSIEDFKKWKSLHDYRDNYDKIKQKFENYNEGCNGQCKYIESMFEIFDDFVKVCGPQLNGPKCPSFFKNCSENDSKKLFEIFQCKEKKNCSTDQLPEAVVGLGPGGMPYAEGFDGVRISQRPEELTGAKGDQGAIGARGEGGLRGSGGRSEDRGPRGEQGSQKEEAAALLGPLEPGQESDLQPQPQKNGLSIGTSSIIAFIGLLSLSFILYKFTPLNSLLCNRNIKKKIQKNLNEDMRRELLTDDFQHQNGDSLSSPYNIKYSPYKTS